MSKTTLSKDSIPENFTLGLALMDAIPVLLFGANALIISVLLGSFPFMLGALVCLFAGVCKVLWKFIVVIGRKNIWWMFMQMRVLMPLGFALMVLDAMRVVATTDLGWLIAACTTLPCAACFVLGMAGMVLMIVLAIRLDSNDVRTNWIEQSTNSVAQAAFFAGLLLVLLR